MKAPQGGGYIIFGGGIRGGKDYDGDYEPHFYPLTVSYSALYATVAVE